MENIPPPVIYKFLCAGIMNCHLANSYQNFCVFHCWGGGGGSIVNEVKLRVRNEDKTLA